MALQTRGDRGGTQEVAEYWLNEEQPLLVSVLSKAPNAPALVPVAFGSSAGLAATVTRRVLFHIPRRTAVPYGTDGAPTREYCRLRKGPAILGRREHARRRP